MSVITFRLKPFLLTYKFTMNSCNKRKRKPFGKKTPNFWANHTDPCLHECNEDGRYRCTVCYYPSFTMDWSHMSLH